MKNLTYLEIRSKFLDHLKKHGHAEIPSASLVPENDPSVLFVNSGMFPLVPYLLGETHPKGTRLTDSQRCLRTGDIDEVGDYSHCTTFEMLGNWSLNDYFKKEAINITIDFFVDVLGLDINKIYGSVFIGDDDAPEDTESIEIWKDVFKKRGIDAKVGKGERIQEFDKDKNWWGLAGGGPCGPCSEIFYDTGKESCGDSCNINCDCGKYLELGNNVLMQYLKKDDQLFPLGRHNIDFGGGLERIAAMVQGVECVFDVDIYAPIYNFVKEISTNQVERSQRIVTDHIKAATWVIADGVVPGRTQREYILRRIIRRAIRHGRILGISNFTRKVGEICIEQFHPVHPLLLTKKDEILNVLEQEERKFNKTIENGLKEFEKLVQTKSGEVFTNEDGLTFKLYETYGFPLEMSIEELQRRGIKLDENQVKANHDKAYEAHQEKSRTASAGLFKGGLADTSEMSTKYHTATHLLLASLYNVVGKHVYQKGSNITTERLRLDFPNEAKLTDEQIKAVEDMVNEQIEKALPVKFEELPKEVALKKVKYAVFDEKYGDVVKVYTIGDPNNPFSVELCGGPHVSNTSELGHFKIIKQENVSAGVKRIKAVLE